MSPQDSVSLPMWVLHWALVLAGAFIFLAFCIGLALGNHWIPEHRRWWYALRDSVLGLSSSYRVLMEDASNGWISTQVHGHHGNYTPLGASLLPLMAPMVWRLRHR